MTAQTPFRWKAAPKKHGRGYKPAEAVSLPAVPIGVPTPEQLSHGRYEVGGEGPARRYRKLSPLDVAQRERRIDDGQHAAGVKYLAHRRAYLAGIGLSGGTCTLDMTPRGASETPAEYAARVQETERRMRYEIPGDLLAAAHEFVVEEIPPRRGYDPIGNPQWGLTAAGLSHLAAFFGTG